MKQWALKNPDGLLYADEDGMTLWNTEDEVWLGVGEVGKRYMIANGFSAVQVEVKEIE